MGPLAMRPLARNQRVLTWLCLCPADKNISKRDKLSHILFAITTFLIEVLGVAGSIAYFITFMRTDLTKSLYSLFQIFGFSGMVYVLIAMFFLRDKLLAIFTKLSDIYKANESDDSIQYLAQANSNSDWMCKMYFKFIVAGVLVILSAMELASVSFCWLFIGKLDPSYLAHPIQFTLPWNQQTLLGYIAECFFSCAVARGYFFSNGTFLILFISIYLYHRAFYEMFQHSTRKFDRLDQNRNDAKLLGDLVDFHNSVKDFFVESTEVYSPVVVVQLVCNMFIITSAIFQLDLLDGIPRIDAILPPILAVSTGMANLFVYCYFGKLATESFEKIADCLYESNWHILPFQLQKYYVPMIASAQRPIYYHGFNLAVLDLRTYCAVLRATFTYFMMLRTITE